LPYLAQEKIMADEIVVPGHIGQFHITGGSIGWPPRAGIGPVMPTRVLDVTLYAQNGSNTVTGEGTLVQTPPGQTSSYARTHFQGTFLVRNYGVGKAFQIFSLNGTPVSRVLGAPFISHLIIDLKALWGNEGTATYTIETSGVEQPAHELTVKDANVTVKWLVKEGVPVHEE
jgi:hypothetical protein